MTEYKLTISPGVQASYLYFREAKHKQTVPLNDGLLMDFAEDGSLIGIEFLSLTLLESFDPDLYVEVITPEEAAELKELFDKGMDISALIDEALQQGPDAYVEFKIKA